MKRKRIILILLVLLLNTCLAACFGPNDPDESEQDGSSSAVGEDSSVDGSSITNSRPDGVPDIRFSEILVRNDLFVCGNFYDYIELYNNGDTEVSLNGWFLSDKPNQLKLLSLDGRKIPAGGYLVVTLDENAGFSLSSAGEKIFLSAGDDIVETLEYSMLLEDRWAPADMYEFPTPGYPNNDEGYMEYLNSLSTPELTINEAMSTNSKYFPDNKNYYDWVELKNNTGSDLDLSKYYISDKKSELTRVRLPAITLKPGGVYSFYCSGLDKDSHIPFKISNSGEFLYISNSGGNCLDALYIPPGLTTDISYGRYNGVPGYMTPTPNEQNAEASMRLLQPPQAETAAGIYEKEFTLVLSGSGEIFYTTDGSKPTKTSARYNNGIQITDNTAIRAVSISGDFTSAEACYTYLIGVSHTLPVVTLTAPDSSIYGSSGIYTTLNKETEVEANFSYIENGSQQFSVNCGISLHGNDSRLLSKKGLQLHFRGIYGTGKLKYKIFDDLDIDSFNSLLLKSGGEDSRYSVLRDELCTSVVGGGATGLFVQAYKPVILYINGEYQGIYYIRERFTDDYVESHCGVSADDVKLVASYGDSPNSGGYYELENYLNTHSMKDKASYEYVMDKINAVSLIDWFLCRSYFGDRDTANVRIFSSPGYDNGRWNWMFYDLDWAFYNTETPFSSIVYNRKMGLIMYKLMENDDFQDMLLKRCAVLFDTVLNEKTIAAKLDYIVDQISEEIEEDRNYWHAKDSSYSTYNGWQSSVERIRAFIKDDVRRTALINDLKRYCGLSDGEVTSYFG